jgi:Haem-binding domain
MIWKWLRRLVVLGIVLAAIAQVIPDGQDHANLNFSTWDQPQRVDIQEILRVVRGGGMPPSQYKLIHANGRLSTAERERLATGLTKTFAADPPIPGDRGSD